MKLLAPLFHATAVLAISLDLRDPRIISRQATSDLVADCKAITEATEALSAALQNFKDASTALAVNGATGKVSDALKKGISDANAISSISQTDAMSLSGPIGGLNDATKKSIDLLISKKSLFVSLGFGGIVLDTLKSEQSQASAFSSAVIAKVPEGLRAIAANLAKPSADAIAAGIAAFSGASSSGGSSTPSSGGSSPPSSGGSSPPSSGGSSPPSSGGSSSPSSGSSSSPSSGSSGSLSSGSSGSRYSGSSGSRYSGSSGSRYSGSSGSPTIGGGARRPAYGATRTTSTYSAGGGSASHMPVPSRIPKSTPSHLPYRPKASGCAEKPKGYATRFSS